MLSTLLFWASFGWFVNYSFPFYVALDLLMACFKGNLAGKLNNAQKELQKTEIFLQSENNQKITIPKLNNLESQAWLYQTMLGFFGENSAANHEKIAKTIEALEYKRSEIIEELKPRKPHNYIVLGELQSKLQNVALSIFTSQAEKDYQEILKIVNNLIVFLTEIQPSPTVILNVIDCLIEETTNNSNKISANRLILVYKIQKLLNNLATKLEEANEHYKEHPDSMSTNGLRTKIENLSIENNKLLRINKRLADEAKNEIYDLKGHIYQLENENLNLQNKLTNLTAKNQKNQEIIKQRENDINNLKLYIEQLKNEIKNLEYQLDDLHNQLADIYGHPQLKKKSSKKQSNQDITKKTKITTEEYMLIDINEKEDYVYVKAHWRKKPKNRIKRPK